MEIKKDEEKLSIYFCEICHYISYRKFGNVKHLSTRKKLAHTLEINGNKKG